MRVWHIHPGYLDSQRLRAVNNELHGIFSCITTTSNAWSALQREYGKSLHYLKKCHDEAMSESILRSSMKDGTTRDHPSKFEIDHLNPVLYSVEYNPSRDQICKDIIDLRAKWDRERYYHGVGRLSLQVLEIQYRISNPGPGLDAAEILREETRTLVKENSWWFKEFRVRNPSSRMQDRVDAFFEEQKRISESKSR